MACAAIDELLAEETNSNSSLLEFIESTLPQLCKIYLWKVPVTVLHNIALLLHRTMMKEIDWMSFLNKLGIVDNAIIFEIQFKSKVSEEFPIYWALKGPLQYTATFGDVVKVIMDNQRFDVLHGIKPDIHSLLIKKDTYSCEFTDSEIVVCEKEKTTYEEFANKKLNESFQGGFIKDQITAACKKGNIRDLSPKKQAVKILLLHADDILPLAEKLCSFMKKAGLSVGTLLEYKNLQLMDEFDIVSSLLTAVDFVVIIVSQAFLKQVCLRRKQSSNEEDESDSFGSNNRYIYKLILREYIQNNCLNIRVRSVMAPNVNRKMFKYEILLANSYPLKKVPDFIDMLKKTKQLLRPDVSNFS